MDSRYVKKAEKEIQKYIDQKVWLVHGFERFMWSKNHVFPSVTHSITRNIIEDSPVYTVNTQPMKFFYHKDLTPSEELEEFKGKIEDVNDHVGKQEYQGAMLEFLTGLAFAKLRKELPIMEDIKFFKFII